MDKFLNGSGVGTLWSLVVNKIQSEKAPLETSVAANTSAITTLVGSDTGKSVRTIANEELATQLIPENASEALDTLTEIAAWIQAHPDDAADMNAAITTLQGLVGDTAVAAQIANALVSYVTTTTLDTELAKIHVFANQDVLDTITQDMIDKLEGIQALTTVEIQAAIQEAEADTTD